MMDYLSRQDRFRSLLEAFLDKATPGAVLYLLLYPNELNRFRDEFPMLHFDVKHTFVRNSSKQFKVEIRF